MTTALTFTQSGPDIVLVSTAEIGPPGPSGGVGSNAWLISETHAQAFAVSSTSYDSHGALLSANLTWADGSTGVYTADTVSTAFPGAVDAYHVTYVKSGVTKTVTQSAFTRNGAGLITTAPQMTVS